MMTGQSRDRMLLRRVNSRNRYFAYVLSKCGVIDEVEDLTGWDDRKPAMRDIALNTRAVHFLLPDVSPLRNSTTSPSAMM